MKKPENLISKEKMIAVLFDLAVVNSAKANNPQVLRKNNIEPMSYIYEKHGIDSIQFVESDRYYASIPKEHEEIFIAVEAGLEKEKERLTKNKKMIDSLKTAKRKEGLKSSKKIKDSLRQIERKKKQ